MIPVYQTIVDPGKGNCLQAAVASLLELQQVPLPLHGHRYVTRLHNPAQLGWAGEWETEDRLEGYKGVKGCFLASVLSPKYFTPESYWNGSVITHAVTIDKNYAVLHDPNPANRERQYPLHQLLGVNGVITVTITEPL